MLISFQSMRRGMLLVGSSLLLVVESIYVIVLQSMTLSSGQVSLTLCGMVLSC